MSGWDWFWAGFWMTFGVASALGWTALLVIVLARIVEWRASRDTDGG